MELCANFVALNPRELVVDFAGEPGTHTIRDLAITIPNAESLFLTGPVISDTFLQSDPLSRINFLPSL